MFDGGETRWIGEIDQRDRTRLEARRVAPRERNPPRKGTNPRERCVRGQTWMNDPIYRSTDRNGPAAVATGPSGPRGRVLGATSLAHGGLRRMNADKASENSLAESIASRNPTERNFGNPLFLTFHSDPRRRNYGPRLISLHGDDVSRRHTVVGIGVIGNIRV